MIDWLKPRLIIIVPAALLLLVISLTLTMGLREFVRQTLVVPISYAVWFIDLVGVRIHRKLGRPHPRAAYIACQSGSLLVSGMEVDKRVGIDKPRHGVHPLMNFSRGSYVSSINQLQHGRDLDRCDITKTGERAVLHVERALQTRCRAELRQFRCCIRAECLFEPLPVFFIRSSRTGSAAETCPANSTTIMTMKS